MGLIQSLVGQVFTLVQGGIRKRVALLMLIFFLGGLFGFVTPLLEEKTGVSVLYFLVIPLALALLAYISTEVAVILLIALLGLILLVFL
jgi:hypothetical protein